MIDGVEGQCSQLLVVKKRRGLSAPRVSAVFEIPGSRQRREMVLHYLEHDAELVRYSETARVLVMSGTRPNESAVGGKLWDLNVVDLKHMRAQALRVNTNWPARGVSDPLEILGIQIRSSKLITADVRLSCFSLGTDSGEEVVFGSLIEIDAGKNGLGAPRGLKASIAIALSTGLRIESLRTVAVADESPVMSPTR